VALPTSLQRDNLLCRHVEQYTPIPSVMFPAAAVIKEREKKYRLYPAAMLFIIFCTVMCIIAFCIFTDLSQKTDRGQDFASGSTSPRSLYRAIKCRNVD
jgi:hypothetical protein